MRYLSENEATRMMGLGQVSELYQDMDGNLYGWVEGVEEWGDDLGDWQGLEAEIPELDGLGALYAAPDGTLFRVQGLAEEEEAPATEAAEPEEPGESEGPRGMGPRRRLRPIPRGLRRPPRFRPRPGAGPARPATGGRRGPPRKKGGFLRKLLPIAKFASKFIPIPGVQQLTTGALDVAGKLLKKPGVAGYAGLGALYAGPDGTLYQVQGLDDEDLNGLYAGEELSGYGEDEELRGYTGDEELQGFGEDEALRGLEDDELRGFADEADLRGLEQGYVREPGTDGLEAYVPVKPPQTRWFKSPEETPELWKPLW